MFRYFMIYISIHFFQFSIHTKELQVRNLSTIMFVGDSGTQKAEIEGARSQAEAVVYNTKVVKDMKDAHVTVPSYSIMIKNLSHLFSMILCACLHDMSHL